MNGITGLVNMQFCLTLLVKIRYFGQGNGVFIISILCTVVSHKVVKNHGYAK
jgi:hypothetical protein